ncbi:MAG: PspA/IM30 family protein [Rhodanobacteraceae bacterium]|nr:PspA/IM30 family protein [Rhodanobacteraceae bacterium]
MAIVNRITRLFAADAHAVLDRLEEPEAQLRQAIREMEAACTRQTLALKQLQAERAQVQSRSNEIRQALVAINEEIELSFQADNQPLIRRSLRRRLEGERLIQMLQQRLCRLDEHVAEQTPLVEQQRQRLEAMRQKAALYDTDCASPAVESSRWSAEDICISEADIDLALLREQQARRSS